eukprot:217293-Rhodomonas_salina.1
MLQVMNPQMDREPAVLTIYANGTTSFPAAAMIYPGADLFGIERGTDPFTVVGPMFTLKRIAQATPVPGKQNIMAIELTSSLSLNSAGSAAITITGLMLNPEDTIVLSITKNDAPSRVFCGQNGSQTFSNISHTLTLVICPGDIMVSDAEYILWFSFMNPEPEESISSPNVYIEAASSDFMIAKAKMDKSGAVVLGVVDGAHPFRIVVPALESRSIGQSSPVAGALNTMTITLMSNLDLRGADESVVTISGLENAQIDDSFVRLVPTESSTQ